tara:strand:+ start:50 stop:385 length:336 start_codon:yes stop_codon:yes gene_type:complete
MLAGSGAKLLLFKNGKDISEFVCSKSENIDFILMDIQMPEMNGLEATETIRKHEEKNHLAKTPIIAFSAFSDDKDIQSALKSGCTDHISKPLKKSDLFHKLDTWLQMKKAS